MPLSCAGAATGALIARRERLRAWRYASGHDMACTCGPKVREMTIELTLPSMTCGHCVKTVTATVQRVDPAAQLSIDLPSHLVRITSAQSEQRFREALAEEGYEATAS